MSAARPGVLITRPREAAIEIAERIVALGFTPVLNPLLELTPTGAAIPDRPFDGIVFTSQAAVRAYPPSEAALRTPVYTVGAQTAEAARQAGFRSVACGGEDVIEFAAWLKARQWQDSSVLLYASGVLVANDLAALMGKPPPAIVRVPLYASQSLSLQKDTIDGLCDGRIAWIMLFSARTSDVLARELDRLDRQGWMAGVSVVCLSGKVAEPILRFGWKHITQAAQPTADAMLACLSEGCERNG